VEQFLVLCENLGFPITSLHGVTTQKTEILIFILVHLHSK